MSFSLKEILEWTGEKKNSSRRKYYNILDRTHSHTFIHKQITIDKIWRKINNFFIYGSWENESAKRKMMIWHKIKYQFFKFIFCVPFRFRFFGICAKNTNLVDRISNINNRKIKLKYENFRFYRNFSCLRAMALNWFRCFFVKQHTSSFIHISHTYFIAINIKATKTTKKNKK